MPNKNTAPGTPTQVAHSGRASVRSTVQNLFPTALAVWGLIVLLPEIADAIAAQEGVPPQIVAGVSAVGAGVAVLTGVFARIMAIPGVEKWLADHKVTAWLATGVHTEVDDTPVPHDYEARYRADNCEEGR